MQDYDELLERAQGKISRSDAHERFEIPEPEVDRQGSNTFVTNFSEIASALEREPKHLMKYLLGELGVPGELQGKRALFQGRFRAKQIMGKIEAYAKEYVYCACGKPDTELVKDQGVLRIKCHACGAKAVVKEL